MYLCISELPHRMSIGRCTGVLVYLEAMLSARVYVVSPLCFTEQTICVRADRVMRPILYLWISPPHLSGGVMRVLPVQLQSSADHSSSQLVWPISSSDCPFLSCFCPWRPNYSLHPDKHHFDSWQAKWKVNCAREYYSDVRMDFVLRSGVTSG